VAVFIPEFIGIRQLQLKLLMEVGWYAFLQHSVDWTKNEFMLLEILLHEVIQSEQRKLHCSHTCDSKNKFHVHAAFASSVKY